MTTKSITIELDQATFDLLEVLSHSRAIRRPGMVYPVLEHLARSAAAGVRRPSAWESRWVLQAFGDGWQEQVEQVPGIDYPQLQPRKPLTETEAQRLCEQLTESAPPGVHAYVDTENGRVCFESSATGRHSLDFLSSSATRVRAHWDGFLERQLDPKFVAYAKQRARAAIEPTDLRSELLAQGFAASKKKRPKK